MIQESVSKRYVRFKKSGQRTKCIPGEKHELLPVGCPGANDEGTTRNLASFSEEITCWKVAEIMGITDRLMRRWHEWYEEFGYDGLLDRRPGSSPPMAKTFSETLFPCNGF